jgi:hypothetical protein
MAILIRPAGLGEDEWAAITEAESRLFRARASSDAALILGSAKDLCETIAKIVIAERGRLTSYDDFPDLLNAAHQLLASQPGEDIANDPDGLQIAAGLKSIVLGIGAMRNRHGTGHGRAVPSGINTEHAELSFETALLWAKWALRRIAPYIAGEATTLVRDLESETFRRGALARRLKLANLPRLSEADQRRVGVAVARRASSGDSFVAEEGIDAVRPEDGATWPVSYLEGLIAGLFFHPNGHLNVGSWGVGEAARLITAMPEPEPVLRRLAERARTASASRRISADEDAQRSVIDAFHRTSHRLRDDQQRRLWREIQRTFGGSEDDP